MWVRKATKNTILVTNYEHLRQLNKKHKMKDIKKMKWVWKKKKTILTYFLKHMYKLTQIRQRKQKWIGREGANIHMFHFSNTI